MRAITAFMLIAFATSAAGNDTAVVKGVLCFVGGKRAAECRSVTGTKLTVAAPDVERTVVWSNADGKQLVFGVLPRKTETIDLMDKALGNVSLSVRGDRRHGWPEDLRIDIADSNKKNWIWTVPAKSADLLADLRMPVGKYTIVFSADHHLKEERRVFVQKNTALPDVVLRPMPAVAGRVLTMKDEPIANVDIVRADGKVVASTGEQGSFRGEVGEPLPDTLLVEKHGFGSQLIPVQFAEGDADLGTIRLSAGVNLSLTIDRPQGDRDPLVVTLQRKTKSKYEYTPVGTKEVAGDDRKLVFGDLDKGDYCVIVEGKAPLERLTTQVELDDTDVEKDIKIEPYRVDGTATIGDDPIDGDLVISMSRFSLNLNMRIENGRFTATLWQHGTLTGLVRAKDLGTYEVVTSPDLGADPSVWDIRFPKRLISGRVYDEQTKQAIDGAKMDLLRSSGDARWYGAIHIQEDGSFSILAVKNGTYELNVTAPDHMAMKQTVEIHEGDDASVERDFPLPAGQLAVLEAVWASGAPVANAVVLDGVAADGYQAERQYTLDAAGKLSLRLQRDETRTLYIVPREGSLAVAHLAAQDGGDSTPMRVVVPNPAGSLHIDISTADGKPASEAAVGMRFNGEFIPAPVLYEIGFRVNLQAVSDRLLLQLPAGAYELWPVHKQSWATSSQSRPPIGAAKNVDLSAGAINVELVTSQ